MTDERHAQGVSRRGLLRLGAGAGIAMAANRAAASGQVDPAALTFIVAGLDSRANYGDYNSDVLMVARVDRQPGAVRAVSIPRDLYVEIPGFGMDKITRAFDLGYKAADLEWEAGAETLTETVETAFGLTVDGIATTTFEGFERIIDAVGGVEVVNPYEVVGDAEIPSFPAGPLILTGEEALVFVRTRSQDTDDGRVMRQQVVLAALLDKLRDPAVVANLPALIAATRGTVETDIPLPVQLDLIDLLPELTAERVTFHTITDSLTGGFIDNGMWVYQADWTVLPGVVQGYLNGTL